MYVYMYRSVQFSCSVVSDSLRPHELQHARPPCPSPTPRVHSDSRPWSQWCHPAISNSRTEQCQNFLHTSLYNRLRKSHMIILTDAANSVQFSSVAQSCPTLHDPMNHSSQASLSITNSWSSLRLTSMESVMPSSHLILCRPLLFLPPIPPSIRVFSNESTLHMRWPKYQSFSFSIIPSK